MAQNVNTLSNFFIEIHDILTELLMREIARMPDEEIKKIKEKYGETENAT